MCQELLQTVLTPLVFHEAELDPRDDWWTSEDGGDWGRYETVELLFIVRELGSRWPEIDWETVSLFMTASGYVVKPENCRSRFEELWKGYESAVIYNLSCGIKNRRKPPFYFKIKYLFGSSEFFDVEIGKLWHTMQ